MDDTGLSELDQGDQFLGGLLERFRAPPALEPGPDEIDIEDVKNDQELDDDPCVSCSPWWRRGASLAGAFGLLLGTLVYLLVPAADVRAVQAIGVSAQAVAGSALLSVGTNKVPDATGKLAIVQTPQSDPVRSLVARSISGASAMPNAAPKVAIPPAAVPGRRNLALRSARRSDRRITKTRSPKMATEYNSLLRRGWARYHKQSFHTSAVAFGRAVHLAPHRTGGYFGLALSLFEQGAEDGAMQVLERGVKKVGPKADLWILAGSIYQFKGKQRLARMAYQRYLRSNPRGKYARDVRVILAYEDLPNLLPFSDDSELTALAGQ